MKIKYGGEKGKEYDPKHTTSSVKYAVMAWSCMAASRTGSLVFIDGVTADRCSMMNSEDCRAMLSAQMHLNVAKLMRQHFTEQMDNDPKQKQNQSKSFSFFSRRLTSHLI